MRTIKDIYRDALEDSISTHFRDLPGWTRDFWSDGYVELHLAALPEHVAAHLRATFPQLEEKADPPADRLVKTFRSATTSDTCPVRMEGIDDRYYYALLVDSKNQLVCAVNARKLAWIHTCVEVSSYLYSPKHKCLIVQQRNKAAALLLCIRLKEEETTALAERIRAPSPEGEKTLP
jgi:hypothetical protein